LNQIIYKIIIIIKKYILDFNKIHITMNRRLNLTIILLLIGFLSYSQSFPGLDRSPLDISYYPDNFAHDRNPGDNAIIKVIYSRPQKRGRELFGNLIPYGKVWRTGANETTEIKFYKDITLQNSNIKAGTYSLFTIPDEQEWTIIVNKDLDFWGAYSYNQENDVIRVKVPSKKIDSPVEAFTIQFEKTDDNHGKMQLAWGETLVEVPFEY